MDKIADAMVKAIKKKLGIKSPSRVMAELGKFTAEGMAVGLKENGDVAAVAAEDIGKKAIEAMRAQLSNVDKIVSGNIDVQPVVRPVLDLTDIRKNAGKIGGLIPSGSKMTLDASFIAATKVAAAVRDRRGAEVTAFEAAQGAMLNYTQVINSPKAVSAVEVYRGTKNQLSTVKGALST